MFQQAGWQKRRNIPATHVVDGGIYASERVFAAEKTQIFQKLWLLVCHESEIPEIGDYRTTEIAGTPIILVRSEGGKIRALLNVCAHRGARIANNASGNTRKFTYFSHLWSYDTDGRCIDIPRGEGYESVGVAPADCNLNQFRVEVRGGLVFVSLAPDGPDLDSFLGQSLHALESVLNAGQKLEVFHFHRSVLKANWKAWMETNLDLYHEFMHVVLRRTQMTAAPMQDRKVDLFPNGHAGVGGLKGNYGNVKSWTVRGEVPPLPGLAPTDFRFVDLFPNSSVIARGTVMRIDIAIPVSPHVTILECLGLGIAGEAPADRAIRIKHHNQHWGPFSRNLPEDTFAAENCEMNLGTGQARSQLIGREENATGQDDALLRNFYAEWSRHTGINPSLGETING